MIADNNGNKMMKSRLGVLFIIFIVVFGYLLMNIGLITFVENENYNQRVLYQYVSKQTLSDQITPKRGEILDRNGIVLAKNTRVYNVVYDPNGMISQPEDIRNYSNQFLVLNLPGVTTAQLNEYIEKYPTSQYRVIAKNQNLEDVMAIKEAIESKEIVGVYLEGYYVRSYPYNTLASNVIGMYDPATSARYGVEEYYNEALTGVYGRMYGYLDVDAFVKQEEILPTNGYNVNLTLDYLVQKYVEEALENYMLEHEAASVNAIVMNPQTGDILAMASYPDFNLNAPYDLSIAYSEEEIAAMDQETMTTAHMELWKNFGVSHSFEPGSTFKSMVLAAALEEDVVALDTEFYCPGYKEVAGKIIKCWKDGGHGTINAYDALGGSCNVAYMDIGALLGKDKLFEYMQLFGMGQHTNVDMIGEASASGVVNKYEDLGPVEIATNSFGQGSNMTSIQIVNAFSSVINGGYLNQPHIMASITDEEGHIIEAHKNIVTKRIISKDTSEILRDALLNVVNIGTGKSAKIEGYEIGGKTGTAEQGDRENKTYVVSFIGFAQFEGEAKVVTMVTIDKPAIEIEGESPSSGLAIGVFVDIMEKALPQMGLFPETPEILEDLEDREETP